MGLVGDVKFPKPALLLSLDVWHNPSNFNLIVGLKPQRLINLNTLKLRHIAIDVAFNTCLRVSWARACPPANVRTTTTNTSTSTVDLLLMVVQYYASSSTHYPVLYYAY